MAIKECRDDVGHLVGLTVLSSVPDLVLYAIPAFVILMAVEGIESYRDGEAAYVDRSDTAASVTMGIGYVLINVVFWKVAALGVLTWAFDLSPLRVGWGVEAWVAMILLDDFSYYWFHRAHHEVRILWASHVVHHSSQRYNLSTALRQTWTPMSAIVFWLPAALLGFHPFLIVTAQSINLLYQFWIHTERIGKLHPWFEAVFNTPSHHRVHHGSNNQYLDRNYAGILIVWDRLFRTFEPEGALVDYGLTRNINTFNPLVIAFHEFRDIVRDVRDGRTLRSKVGYVFRGPGWAYEQRAAEAAAS